MTKEDGKLHISETFGKVMEPMLHDTTITDGAVRLYAHMHWRYGTNRDNHEGQKSMAKHMGVSEKTIRNRIDELESHDWVVTIYQELDDKKQYQRCYYHVFETQAECIKFRAEFKAVDGDKMKDKPEARQRKSRKGAGNPAAIPPGQRNSGSDATDGTQVLTASGTQVPTGQRNSGSEDLEAVHLDSSIQTQKESPQGGEKTTHIAIGELIQAWLESTETIQPSAYSRKTNRDKAEALHKAGITPDDIRGFVATRRKDKFYADKPIDLDHICKSIRAWKKATKPTPSSAPPPPTAAPQPMTVPTPAMLAALRAGVNRNGLSNRNSENAAGASAPDANGSAPDPQTSTGPDVERSA